PINNDGVVLSQPMSRTTPSIGLPRIDSSTSMLARLRKSIAVGRSWVSPSDMTGNSSGKPPDSQTPRLTNSAISRKCALQGVSSDQVLQMPIMGRPSNRSCGQPWFFIQLRYTKPSRSRRPYHSWERSFFIRSSWLSALGSQLLALSLKLREIVMQFIFQRPAAALDVTKN